MLVSVDVEGANVGRSADQVDFDVLWRAKFWVVGFEAVVAVGVFSFGLVYADQADMTCLEEPVEVHSS